MWPQIIVIIILISGVRLTINKNGKLIHSIISSIINSGIMFFLLYAGGFFEPLGWGG